MTELQNAWFKKYLVTVIITAAVSAMALDGGILFLGYIIAVIPITTISFIITKKDKIARLGLLAIVIPLITLGLTALIIEIVPK